ncbi:MAG: hypothetical protein ACP5R5_03230, partial [Armatimonadota bacterium]
LGSALHAAGIHTAVVGNSTLPGEPHAEAATIAMDRAGLVDLGDVDSPTLTIPDPHSAYGIRSDPDRLMHLVDRVLARSRFVVVDFGDTYRADRYCEFCSEAMALRLRRSAVVRLDELIGRICTRLDFDKDALVLLSPSPRRWSEIENERLTPIVIRGPGFCGGMLTSPSTRRQGLVTICDVAPTMLSFFGLRPPADMIGRPMESVPHKDAVEALLRLNLEASLQAERQVAMRGSSVVQSIVVALVTLAVICGGGRLRRAAAWTALTPVAIPLAMLYVPALCSAGLAGTVACIAALTSVLLAGPGLLLRSPMRAFMWLCGGIVFSVLVDLTRGAPLISRCVAGYSLVEGARYYGLGNELMGTLLGATIMGTGAAAVRGFFKWIGAAVFPLVFFFIGWPRLGADAGGAAAAAPAMAVALLGGRGRGQGRQTIGLALLAGLVGLTALFVVDALKGGGAQSHIGRMVELLISGRVFQALNVVQRKVMLNLTLLGTSLWSRLLALSVTGAALLYYHGRRRFGVNFLPQTEKAAALGCCVGTLTAFAFNDSGVLAAAACSVFLWTRLVLGLAGGDGLTEATGRPNGDDAGTSDDGLLR